MAPAPCSAPHWCDTHWFPVASIHELDPLRPTPVRIDGRALVVWHVPAGTSSTSKRQKHAVLDDGGWRVFEDACPHRLAPLSEGRLEPKTGCLQCAYHGWEFDGDGKCKKIPSADIETCARACTMEQSCAVKFPSQVAFGVVWVWLGSSEPKEPPASLLVGTALEGEVIRFTYTRDLPYGYDTLMENLLDPSHVPFAHHGLQGTRSDAYVKPLEMFVHYDKSGDDTIKFVFDDHTTGKDRHADFVLLSPFLAYYRGQFTGMAAPYKFQFLCVPVAPGESRVILVWTDKPGEGYRAMLHRLPVWFVHLHVNRFLDSDLAFLHYQERTLRSAPRSAEKWQSSYFLPAKSDRSISAWRRWLARQGARCVAPEYAAELLPSPPRQALFDRFQQHTGHCLVCQRALDGVAKWRRRAIGLGLGAIALDRLRVGPQGFWLFVQLASVGMYAGLGALRHYFYFGDYKHYKN